MKKVDNLSIHVTFEKEFCIYSKITRREFLPTICGRFGLSEDEFELYEENKGSFRKISVNDLKNRMKIRIMKKGNPGVSVSQSALTQYFEKGQSSKAPTLEEGIIQKLKMNSALNGIERQHLTDLLSGNFIENSLKRKRNGENTKEPKKQANKKVQINVSELKEVKNAFTQTERLATESLQNGGHDKNLTKKLKQMASEDSANKEQIFDLMNKTFDARRTFITVKLPSVVQVKEEYPLLFSLDEVKNELDRIFYIGKCEEFIRNIEVYTPVILKVLEEREPDNAILLRTKKCSSLAQTSVQRKYAEEVGSLMLLPKLFNDSLDFIYLLNSPNKPGVMPHIAVLENSIKPLFFDTLLYKIIVEDKQLCEAPTLKEAILCLVASFFIFNIEYPPECSRTYIAFEKLFLDANDTEDIDTGTEQMIKYIKLKASRIS